jgi:iron complex outermembrane recepter protein
MATQLRRIAGLAGLALLFAGTALGQEAGSSIAGVITDATTGKPVVGATVTVTGPALEGSRVVQSEGGGAFTVPDLPAGAYAVAVQMDGYKPYLRTDLQLKANTTLRAPARLAPVGSDADEVVVTGTRIRRKDLTTAAPVAIIDRAQIEKSGVVGLGEFLQQLPQQGNALNAQQNYGNDGEVRVDLRSLGSERTLVLVNGRRMVSGGAGGDSPVDLNTIPLAAVERIEVLKDGASAIYGSDAIAGVVNVILRDKFEGTQLSAQAGVSSRGDAQSYDLNASTGVTGEKGSAFFSAGYQEQRPIYASARSWSAYPLVFDYTSRTASRTGSWYIPNGDISIRDVDTVCANPGGIGNPVLRQACQDWAGSDPDPANRNNHFTYDPQTGGYRLRTGADNYNYQPDSYLLTPVRRLQLFMAGNYQLSPAVRAFYQASFVNRQSKNSASPMPVDATVSGQSLYNPFGTDVDVGKRMMEFGVRTYGHEVNTIWVVGGLDGALGGWAGPLEGWAWELSYDYGRNTSTDTISGQLRAPQLAAGTGPSFDDGGVPTCGTPGAAVSGCTPIDLLHGVGTLTPEQLQTLGYAGGSHGFNELHVFSGSASGSLFTLWADRPAGLAVGFDLRSESGGNFPDPIAAAGESTGTNQQAVSGGYSARELYAELNLPLLSQQPFAQDLELTAALRNVSYTSFGANTSYKLGGRWMPVRDLTLRGTFSTAFRAPNVLELYQGATDSYEYATDPCSDPTDPAIRQQCIDEIGHVTGDYGSGQIHTIQGGNTQLQPETAKTVTAGLVVEPHWVKDLAFTLDYWDIRLDGTVDTIGTSNILAGCYTGDPATSNGGYCGRVHRDPATGRITSVDDRSSNIGGTRTTGVDFAARWLLPARSLGRFRLDLDGTYLVRYDKTYSDGSVVKAAGTYDLQFILPRWRWAAGVGWQRGPLGLTTDARYIGSFQECGNGAGESGGGSCTYSPEFTRTVSSYVIFDMTASYLLASGAGTTALTVGVRNLFDTAPPVIYNGGDNNTDPAYDFVGRYFWARVTHRF